MIPMALMPFTSKQVTLPKLGCLEMCRDQVSLGVTAVTTSFPETIKNIPERCTCTLEIHPGSQPEPQRLRDARFAIRLSLIVGLLMMLGKLAAYFMTHSTAILPDATESVVHEMAGGSLPLLAFNSVPNPLTLDSCMGTNGLPSFPPDLKER